MEITTTQNGESCLLTLSGRLDTATAPKLQEALTKAISSDLATELDFAAVEYVSSAGLRVLLQGQKKAQSIGSKMTLKNVRPDVMEVFDITGFSGILTIV